MNCKKCQSSHIIKYGTAQNHVQRYLCHDCHSTFTNSEVRKRYSFAFIDAVMEKLCHQHHKVREVLSEFKISSRTLMKRKHKHQEQCPQCKSQTF